MKEHDPPTPLEKLTSSERRSVFLQTTALLIVPAAIIILLAISAGVGYALWRVESVARDTNNILRGEVQEKDQQIAALEFVLNQQAAPGLIYLLRQCQRQGRDCPEILLSPSEPTFEEQLKEHQSAP